MTRSHYLWTCLLISLKKRAALLLALALLGGVLLWIVPLPLALWVVGSVGWALLLLGYVAASSWSRHRDDWVSAPQTDAAQAQRHAPAQQNNGHS